MVACFWCGDSSAYNLKQKFKEKDFSLFGKSKVTWWQRAETHRKVSPRRPARSLQGWTSPTSSLHKLFLLHSPHHICSHTKGAGEILSRQCSFLTRRHRSGVTGAVLWAMKLCTASAKHGGADFSRWPVSQVQNHSPSHHVKFQNHSEAPCCMGKRQAGRQFSENCTEEMKTNWTSVIFITIRS